MNKSPKYWNKAKKYLSKKDKIMKDLILLGSTGSIGKAVLNVVKKNNSNQLVEEL